MTNPLTAPLNVLISQACLTSAFDDALAGHDPEFLSAYCGACVALAEVEGGPGAPTVQVFAMKRDEHGETLATADEVECWSVLAQFEHEDGFSVHFEMVDITFEDEPLAVKCADALALALGVEWDTVRA